MSLFIGFYMGFTVMIVIYNIHWYIITRDKSSLYYSIFKALGIVTYTIIAYNLSVDGALLYAIVTVLLICIVLFVREFLELKKYIPLAYIVLNIVIIILTFGYFVCVYIDDYSVYNQPFSLLVSPGIFLGVIAHLRGNETAKYLVIAWTFSVSTFAIHELNQFEIIDLYPSFPFDLTSELINSIILSYAIFVKTRTVYRENEEKIKIMIHQSKLAASGQMLENISHQWHQPLNRISAYIMNMQSYLLENKHQEQYLSTTLSQSQKQLEYMADTLQDFTSFHRREAKKDKFMISTAVENVFNIIGQTLEHKGIKFELQINSDFEIYSYPNELSQVLLNLVQNAQDELIRREVNNSYIKIVVAKHKINVIDNAGGVDKNTAARIFDAYYTTKNKDSSLGLGLFMCKTILNKYFQTEIKLEQYSEHTNFSICFKHFDTALAVGGEYSHIDR